MYNILLAVGVAVAVIVGGIIGLRFMTVTSAEEKAEITKLLIPYLIGCIVVFGGFAIWRNNRGTAMPLRPTARW